MNELSVVVPCLSTLETLPSFLDTLAKKLMENPTDVDLIVVANEGDDIDSVTEHIKTHYPWLKFSMLQRKGKGRSYGALARFGIAYSTSQYAVLVSPYNEDDLSILFTMLKEIRGGAQLVQATRFTSEENHASLPKRFHLYQQLYRALLKVYVGVDITDSTYAYKMFDRTFMQALGMTHTGYSLCPEMTLKGVLAGGKVVYVPSTLKTSALNNDFHLLKEGPGYLRVLLRASLHRIGISWF
jgi:hypothetical protein